MRQVAAECMDYQTASAVLPESDQQEPSWVGYAHVGWGRLTLGG